MFPPAMLLIFTPSSPKTGAIKSFAENGGKSVGDAFVVVITVGVVGSGAVVTGAGAGDDGGNRSPKLLTFDATGLNACG